MYWNGLVIGAASFLTIGLFHPIVIKCEYHFSSKIWPVFLVLGILLCAVSVLIKADILSAVLAVAGFASFWSIGELRHQRERVEKGWFPKNPARVKH